MKISLITICYNNESTIGDTIRSVIAQQYPELEYIIVDGLSSDNTLDIIRKYHQPYFKVVSEKDNGIYDALNKGVRLATGDVIGMLHADDLFASNDVLNCIADKLKSSQADALYGNLVYVKREDITKIIRYWNSGNYKVNSFRWGWMPPHPTFYVKKEMYTKYGNFNIDLKSAADYELMLRFIHKYKISLAYLNIVMIRMRVGGQSNVTLKNRLMANKEDHQAWRINDLKPYFFTRYLKPLRKIFQFLFK